jgi:hypothetical protein
MKIMGRVARLILLVVVSVCVVFCVLCCLQNNTVFSSVTYLIISKNENYELCILAGFFVTTGKKSSSRFLVLAGNRRYFSCGGKVLLRPEKKF